MARTDNISVAILAGGLGTRLRPATGDEPKVLAPVGERPFITRLLDQLLEFGATEAVLCVGHGRERIEAQLGTGHGGLALRYAREETPLGTGGALRNALPLLEATTVLVLNGDSYCETPLSTFLGWHHERDATASLVLSRMEDRSRFGSVKTAEDGSVTAFLEKGRKTGPGWINAGIYLLQRDRIAAIPGGRAVSLEQDIFPALVGAGLFGWRHGGRFLDIGTPASYLSANGFFSRDGEQGDQ